MPVTPTYPGIYIQELLSNSHTITAAPTSVTVFVGYTHPFKTPSASFGQAIEIFSPQDYQRQFGGQFSVDWLADDVGQAVNEFFLNGGTTAYVVGLQAQFYDLATNTPTAIQPPMLTIPGTTSGTGIVFTGLEPVDGNKQLDRVDHEPAVFVIVQHGDRPRRHHHHLRNDDRDVPRGDAEQRGRRQLARGTDRHGRGAGLLAGDRRAQRRLPELLAAGHRPDAADHDHAVCSVHHLLPRRLRPGVRAGRLAGQGADLQPPANAGDLGPAGGGRGAGVLRAQACFHDHGPARGRRG